MFRLILAKMLICIAVLASATANAQLSGVVHTDETGVEMFYQIQYTGQKVNCSEQFKNDQNSNYTTKGIKIWRVIVTVANRSDKRIYPRGWSSSINVEESTGSSLDYCHFDRHPSFQPFAGTEHSLLSFGVTHNPRNYIAPGQVLQASRYIYLYEDRRPVVTSSFFPGYKIAKDKTAGKKKAKPKPKQQTKVAAANRRMQVRTGSNVRIGPGTTYRKIGRLRAGQEVQVTGKSGDWLRIKNPGGYVHGSLLTEMSQSKERPKRQTTKKTVAVSPKCAGMAKGANCWKEIANKRNCYIWDNFLVPDQTVTWSGACSGGIAVGRGTAVWTTKGKSNRYTGSLVRGKKQGRWVIRFPGGTVAEGPYVNGKTQGRWVLRYASGEVHEGPFVNGKRQGRWVLRGAGGAVHEGPYVNGKRQGRWVLRYASGNVHEGPFVNGKRQGRWVIRFAGGTVAEGPYVNGKQQGRWVSRQADGTVAEGPYVNGKQQGRWVIRFASGKVEEGPYVNGKKQGRWVIRKTNGNVEEGSYVNGKEHGRWVERFADGSRLEYEYRNGSRDGQPGVFTLSGGTRIQGRWSGKCFRGAGKGKTRLVIGTKKNCAPR